MHVRRSRLCNHPGPPPLTQTTFLACCAHYPGGPIRADGYRFERAPAPGSFRIDSAFPAKAPGRHPHCSFRGLLKLYSRYGPPSCSPTFRGLCREVPARPVSRPNRSPAIESNHQLFEWVLPPLVICPLGAHALAPDATGAKAHDWADLAARLKPCPDTKPIIFGFARCQLPNLG